MTPNTELQKAIERVEHEVKISSVSDFDPFKSDIEHLLSAAKQLQQVEKDRDEQRQLAAVLSKAANEMEKERDELMSYIHPRLNI
jgi:acyl-CoA reductase-like NAD-dependent aldehyde dehydrogenase